MDRHCRVFPGPRSPCSDSHPSRRTAAATIDPTAGHSNTPITAQAETEIVDDTKYDKKFVHTFLIIYLNQMLFIDVVVFLNVKRRKLLVLSD